MSNLFSVKELKYNTKFKNLKKINVSGLELQKNKRKRDLIAFVQLGYGRDGIAYKSTNNKYVMKIVKYIEDARKEERCLKSLYKHKFTPKFIKRIANVVLMSYFSNTQDIETYVHNRKDCAPKKLENSLKRLITLSIKHKKANNDSNPMNILIDTKSNMAKMIDFSDNCTVRNPCRYWKEVIAEIGMNRMRKVFPGILSFMKRRCKLTSMYYTGY
ncbi:hypothetical protein [Heterosigma akashiwo virus 01]|jgi:hypothetical protein|uniref:Protein kinase domain-containing protein n=1 Tax=Heterosigma akashiwo virus 01 TaxID=97195 RepID=A0A1C9C4Z8_HAV01|nr:hypothetical protein D1R72_gp029 [Heterosigma akashiwo virus 01]AOM63360.1 hypothetical protein [Heterosigma akashiwo virus 01]